MDEHLETYRDLKQRAAEVDAAVARAEERLSAAQDAARSAAEEARALGFESVADLEQAKSNLEAEVRVALEKVKEAVS